MRLLPRVELLKIMKKLVIHIGYPKTGTTALQKHIFTSLSFTGYLGLYDRYRKKYALNEDFVNDVFSLSHSAFLFKYKKTFLGEKELGDFSSYILSEENFITNAMLPSYDRCNYNRITQDLNTTLLNLQCLFKGFDIKILLTIRNQVDLIPSFYAQHFYKRFKGNIRLNKYSKFVKYVCSNDELGCLFDYSHIVSLSEKIFGKNNVNVCVFEEMKSRPSTFVSRLSSILEEDINFNEIPRENIRKMKNGFKADNPYNLYDISNKLFRKPVSKRLSSIRVPDSLVLPTIENTAELLSEIETRFKESNKYISCSKGLDLYKLGYLI